MPVQYKPFADRTADMQYPDLLRRILNEGVDVMPQQEEGAKMVLGHQMRFDLRNGFPMITQRDLSARFNSAMGEHFAFLAGERHQAELVKRGCRWWSSWVTEAKCQKRGLETGDLGPGSYGPAWRSFPTSEGGSFDQITHLVEQIRELPHLRTHIVTPFIPQYLGRGQGKTQKVVVVPCHGFLHYLVYPESGEISLHHIQRSADAPVGLVFNMIQYAAMLMMVGQVTGYSPKELVYTISDAHIFNMQKEGVDELLSRPAKPFPTVALDPDVKNIFDFRPEHFTIEDYNPDPWFTIPTPV